MSRLAILCLILCFLAQSCASSTPTGKSPAGVAAKGTDNSSDMPTPPEDAQYTIRCQSYAGLNHAEESRMVAQQLRIGTSMKDWYVIHQADYSTLYYGFYRTFDPRDSKDAKEGERAIKDLDAIRSMADSTGFRPFSASLPVLLDSPDPAADPKWDLARSGGYYSLEIAVYKDSPKRKEAAVESVKELRAHGIEAYYYHGPVASSVCIGAWPQSSAEEIDPSQENTDPNAPLVLTASPLGEDAARQFAQRGIKAVAPRLDPVDPSMIQTMRQFRTHSINGEMFEQYVVDPATGQKKLEPPHSFLVKIPQPGSTDDQSETPMVDNNTPPGDIRPAPASDHPAEPGVGQLKSLGE